MLRALVDPTATGAGSSAQVNTDQSDTNNGDNDPSYNRRNALRVIMDYYKNNDKFSGSLDDDWTRHLKKFKDLCSEYPTDESTIMRHFSHSIQDTSQAYHYYVTLMEDPNMDWATLTQCFHDRYHSLSRRTRFSRQLKILTFKKIRQEENSDDAAFKKNSYQRSTDYSA